MQYVNKGTTDDVTVCGMCGREDLQRTVVFGVYDQDNNETDRVYFGVDCASKVTRRSTTTVRNDAADAEIRRRGRARDAREFLAVFEPLTDDERTTLYLQRNPRCGFSWLQAYLRVSQMMRGLARRSPPAPKPQRLHLPS